MFHAKCIRLCPPHALFPHPPPFFLSEWVVAVRQSCLCDSGPRLCCCGNSYGNLRETYDSLHLFNNLGSTSSITFLTYLLGLFCFLNAQMVCCCCCCCCSVKLFTNFVCIEPQQCFVLVSWCFPLLFFVILKKFHLSLRNCLQHTACMFLSSTWDLYIHSVYKCINLSRRVDPFLLTTLRGFSLWNTELI